MNMDAIQTRDGKLYLTLNLFRHLDMVGCVMEEGAGTYSRLLLVVGIFVTSLLPL